MINYFNGKPSLDTNYILAVLDQRKIIAKYTKQYPQIKKKIKSPYRDFGDANCAYYFNTKKELGIQKLYFQDFSHPEYSGDIFDCVGHILRKQYGNVTVNEVCHHIARTFRIHKYNPNGIAADKLRNNHIGSGKVIEDKATKSSPKNSSIKNRTIIKPIYKKSDRVFINYFKSYQIRPSTRERFRVYNLDSVLVKSGKGIFSIQQEGYKPLIDYNFGGGYHKIYRPYDKLRFINNTNNHIVQGLSQLNPRYFIQKNPKDFCIITKSYKDVMCLYEFGIDAIAPQGEGLLIPEYIIDWLKFRYKYVLVWFDADYTGLSGMELYKKEYGLDSIIFPTQGKVKDISDSVLINGFEISLEFVIDILYDHIENNKDSDK